MAEPVATDPPAPVVLPFSNDALDPSGFPRLEDETFIRLDPAFLQMRMALTALVAILVAAAVSAVIILLPVPLWVLAPAVAIVFALAVIRVVLVRLDFRHRSWLLRTHDLSYRSGVISRDVETVPFNRVQHVIIEHGPIERVFGLATVRVLTAGGILGLVQIKGLTDEVAENLRTQVLSRVEATR